MLKARNELLKAKLAELKEEAKAELMAELKSATKEDKDDAAQQKDDLFLCKLCST